MKKKKITYGVDGMMEYVAVINIGSKSSVRIQFSNGSITAMGVAPAVFTTENLMLQHAIEHSSDYARGLIKTVRVVELEAEVKIERNMQAQAPDTGTNSTPQGCEEEAQASGAETNTEINLHREVMFSNNGDAKVWLEEQFGVSPSKLRSREIIENVAKGYGVAIKWVE